MLSVPKYFIVILITRIKHWRNNYFKLKYKLGLVRCRENTLKVMYCKAHNRRLLWIRINKNVIYIYTAVFSFLKIFLVAQLYNRDILLLIPPWCIQFTHGQISPRTCFWAWYSLDHKPRWFLISSNALSKLLSMTFMTLKI